MRNPRSKSIRESIHDLNQSDSDRDVKSADWRAVASRGCRSREFIQAINGPNKERSVLSPKSGFRSVLIIVEPLAMCIGVS